MNKNELNWSSGWMNTEVNEYWALKVITKILFNNFYISSVSYFPDENQNNGAQQLASEATVYIMLEDVNDEIPLFTEREQETVLEGEPIGTKVTQVNAIDKDGTFPANQVKFILIIFFLMNDGSL